VKEATIENLVGEDNVGYKHFKMFIYKCIFYLGFEIGNILFIIIYYFFFLMQVNFFLC